MNIMQKCAYAICPIKQKKRQWLQGWAVHTLAGVIGKICCIHSKQFLFNLPGKNRLFYKITRFWDQYFVKF